MQIKVAFRALSPLLGTKIAPPAAATTGSAAIDIRACVEQPVVIPAGGRALIPSGFAIAIPSPDIAGLVFARSGLAAKSGICLANGVGLIDSDYRGEIMVGLFNSSGEDFTILPGDRVAQLAFVPVHTANLVMAEDLEDTERGTGGFGSTGLK